MTPEQERGPGAAPQPVLTVAAVARRLGVAPSTLRTWDRRYGLGPSAHTAGSHRRYGPDDLHRLSVMRGLTMEGVPPAEAAQIALGAPVRDRSGEDRPLEPTGIVGLAPGTLGDGLAEMLHLPGGAAGELPGGAAGELPGGAAGEPAPDGGVGPVAGLPLAGAWSAPASHPARLGDHLADRPGPRVLPFQGPSVRPLPGATSEPGRGAAVWITQEPLPGAQRAVPPAEALDLPDDPASPTAVHALLGGGALLGPAGLPGRAGGGRVLSLPDASPRARGLARAAMALDTFEVQRILRDAIAVYGVVGTWESMVVPVLTGLGERWRATDEGVDVEHAFCEAVAAALRGVTLTLYRPRNVVPVLLACADGDLHSLPLHVVAAALAEEEVGCRMLGAGVPSSALVSAVRRTGPAVVLLHACMPVRDGTVLRELPRQRPAPRVLVGGPGWDGVALPTSAVRVQSLAEALAAVLAAARP